MKKILFIICLSICTTVQLIAQTTTFDNLNANSYVNKAITWNTSDYGSGSGHRIINSDPGGQTLLNFQIRHNTTTWSDLLTLSTLGRIGIGTTIPSSTLFIKQSSDNSTGGLSIADASAGRLIQIYGEGSGGRQVIRTSGTTNPLAFDLNGSEKMRINSEGNIGIGTINPKVKLHVYESKTLGTTLGDFQILSRTSGKSGSIIMENNWLLRDETAISNWFTARYHNGLSVDASFLTPGVNTRTWWERDPKDGSQFWGNASEIQMTLINGNIGIGTTDTKGFKLGVLGKIAAEEVKVATYANWSDFVFNKDYNLPTLKEVEHHIKEKGHLQNIPSADDVKINGFFLAEMNAKLLQKIEELMLYTIQQEKEIDVSKNEIILLKNKATKVDALRDKFQNQKAINKSLESRLQKIESLLISAKH